MTHLSHSGAVFVQCVEFGVYRGRAGGEDQESGGGAQQNAYSRNNAAMSEDGVKTPFEEE